MVQQDNTSDSSEPDLMSLHDVPEDQMEQLQRTLAAGDETDDSDKEMDDITAA